MHLTWEQGKVLNVCFACVYVGKSNQSVRALLFQNWKYSTGFTVL